jgi:hypothetical protein
MSAAAGRSTAIDGAGTVDTLVAAVGGPRRAGRAGGRRTPRLATGWTVATAPGTLLSQIGDRR